MARLSEHGLRRSVGVPGLFATAYGNVGSSIYYALGLVAAHALGLTPLVFMFAGGLFVLTAKTYAEGAAMFPEAGGSSSFARHAFNDVVSFFAGWALSLDYIITIAISAFFVPHYLGAFFPALTHNPGDIIGGLVTIALLAALNIRGLGESAKLNLFLAVADLCTQVLLVGLGVVLVLNPSLLVDQVHLGIGAELDAADLRAVGRDGRLHRHRDRLEHGRGGQGPRPRRAQGGQPRADRRARRLRRASRSSRSRRCRSSTTASATPHSDRPRRLRDRARRPLRKRPGARASSTRLGLHGTVLTIARVLRRRARRDDPVHRHQRRADRDLAAVVVAGRAPPAAEHLLAACTRRFRTPWFTIVFFSVLAGAADPARRNQRCSATSTRSGRCCRSRPRTSRSSRCASRTPTASAPTGCRGTCASAARTIPLTAVLGAIGTFAAWCAVVALHAEARTIGIPWMVVGMVGYFVYRRRQGLDPRSAYQHRAPERPPDFEELDYRTALVPIFGDDVSASALRERRQADRRRRRRLRDLRAAGAQPALARGGPRGGGGARALGARERAHPGAPRRASRSTPG